jgi:sarcosine oxidase subunit alpha
LITLTINNREVIVAEGTTVAAAVLESGCESFRKSVSGDPRGPLCGMAICFECRITINGIAHERSCNIVVRDGMEVMTDE